MLKDRQLQQLQDELTAERHEVQQVLKEFAAKNELIQQLNDALQVTNETLFCHCALMKGIP